MSSAYIIHIFLLTMNTRYDSATFRDRVNASEDFGNAVVAAKDWDEIALSQAVPVHRKLDPAGGVRFLKWKPPFKTGIISTASSLAFRARLGH